MYFTTQNIQSVTLFIGCIEVVTVLPLSLPLIWEESAELHAHWLSWPCSQALLVKPNATWTETSRHELATRDSLWTLPKQSCSLRFVASKVHCFVQVIRRFLQGGLILLHFTSYTRRPNISVITLGYNSFHNHLIHSSDWSLQLYSTCTISVISVVHPWLTTTEDKLFLTITPRKKT